MREVPDQLTASFAHTFPDHRDGFSIFYRQLAPHIIRPQVKPVARVGENPDASR
ncbi:hypothetical protein GCM10023335_56550 [Streptomyces siamensis]|uniref:Uncharacterized protein n=1 Tax=Streptomyces siamensis TaxID=1274986 RepID=A0ABP9JA79_9ACTN